MPCFYTVLCIGQFVAGTSSLLAIRIIKSESRGKTLAKEDKARNGTGRHRLPTRRFGSHGTVRRYKAPVDERALAAEEVTRSVPAPVQCMLWGRAAGRCEFGGCNQPLWKSSVTQEQVNIAEKAHIYSFSCRGPRGNIGISEAHLHDLTNLMLVCHACHRKVDRERDGGRYTVSLLQQMKGAH